MNETVNQLQSKLDQPGTAGMTGLLLAATAWHSVERLSRAMLHELKAPLNVMVINVELLKALDDGGGGVASNRSAQREALNALKDAIGTLSRDLEGLFARTFRHDAQQSVFDLVEVIEEIEALVHPQAVLEHVAFQLNLPAGPVHVHGDRFAIKQAILNVFIDALDTVVNRGVVRVDLEDTNECATIRLVDNGRRMLAAEPEKTDPQIKQSVADFGLHATRAILAAHGGTLAVESSQTTGTTLRMTLPGGGPR